MEIFLRKISDAYHLVFFLIVLSLLVMVFYHIAAGRKDINQKIGTVTSVEDRNEYIPYHQIEVKGSDVIAVIHVVSKPSPNKIKIKVIHGSYEAVYGYADTFTQTYQPYRITNSSDPFYIEPLANYNRKLELDHSGIQCVVFTRQ